MAKYLLILLVAFAAVLNCAHAQNCVENINKQPMYGGVKKCPEQIAADRAFFKYCDSTFLNRKEAAKQFIGRGWQYFYQHKLDTAMMRFNQGWLLDSLNAESYWGFGNLLGMQQKYRESLTFFDRSLRIDPTNAKVWESASNSYGQLFVKTSDKRYLIIATNYLKRAIRLAPNTPRTYAQLTMAYAYLMQKDSARKYLAITDKLDKKAVNQNIRKMIISQ